MKTSFYLSILLGAVLAPLAAQAQLPLGGSSGGLLGGVLGRSGSTTGGSSVTGGSVTGGGGGGGVVGGLTKSILPLGGGGSGILGGLVNTNTTNSTSSGLLGGLLTPVLSLTTALPVLGGGLTSTILSPLGLASSSATGSSGLLGLNTGIGGLGGGGSGVSLNFNQGWAGGYPFESNSSGLWYLYGSSPYRPFLPFTTSFSSQLRPPLTPTIQPLTIGAGLR